MVSEEPCWTLISKVSDSPLTQASGQQEKTLRSSLESKNDATKIDAMKALLQITLAGNDTRLSASMIMTVIRFVLPSKNKTLKKLLLVYWEICPKKDPNGKLKQEMILVCNFLRNDLQSPNEFVRGTTLRLLCKLKEPELLEPLIPSARQGLEHRSTFVRKNAVLALFSMYKQFPNLIPDAAELIHKYLLQETSQDCKQSAFQALSKIDHARALDYLMTILPIVDTFDTQMQLAIVDLIRTDSQVTNESRGGYIKAILTLLENTQSAAVKFDAATALMALTQSPAAVAAVGKCYVDLAIKESDNNVKLIVLGRFAEIKQKYGRTLDEMAIDVLRVLSSKDIEVCKKAIDVVLELLSSRNVKEVVQYLQKEVQKDPLTQPLEYRQLLIHGIHQCAIKFPESSAEVVHVLMEFLGDTAAVDVISFVREVIECNASMRQAIIGKLLASFSEVKSGKVVRGALWIVGEYCQDLPTIQSAFATLRKCIGPLPILATEQKLAEDALEAENVSDKPAADEQPKNVTRTRVLADGTYATESAFTAVSPQTLKNAVAASNKPNIRGLIISGDYFVGAVLATALTKLVLRLKSLKVDAQLFNTLRAESMLVMTSIIRVGQSNIVTAPIDEDSYTRVVACLRVLSNSAPKLYEVFLQQCHQIYAQIVANDLKKTQSSVARSGVTGVGVDQLVQFRQLLGKSTTNDAAALYEQDIIKAAGTGELKAVSTNKLNRVVQLTGFSDSVYAEAYVDVHQYDVMLEVLVVNQTPETLQNMTVEFSTLGDLKLIERPAPHNMGPHSFHSIKANIKVSSTENGVIFGNIVYDNKGATDTTVVILNDIHLDIMDYIQPAECSENQFLTMWTEFEWENKININTNIKEISEFLEHVKKITNMNCLTSKLTAESGFLSANLYARSIFGEDALANISMEQSEKSIQGALRIRSKTQGIALALGEKITSAQSIRNQ